MNKFLFSLVFILLSCGSFKEPRKPEDGYNSIVNILNTSKCKAGGITLISAIDINRNGLIDIGVDANIMSAEICNGVDGIAGKDGAKGDTGTQGQAGQDGMDGEDGAQGAKGDKGDKGDTGAAGSYSAFTPTALINPCGDAPGVMDEVFLKLANGTLIASFSENANGKNTRFSVLVPGTYVTTDGDNCTFIVDSSGNVVNESHHY